jgi:hypothetical protein
LSNVELPTLNVKAAIQMESLHLNVFQLMFNNLVVDVTAVTRIQVHACQFLLVLPMRIHANLVRAVYLVHNSIQINVNPIKMDKHKATVLDH